MLSNANSHRSNRQLRLAGLLGTICGTQLPCVVPATSKRSGSHEAESPNLKQNLFFFVFPLRKQTKNGLTRNLVVSEPKYVGFLSPIGGLTGWLHEVNVLVEGERTRRESRNRLRTNRVDKAAVCTR